MHEEDAKSMAVFHLSILVFLFKQVCKACNVYYLKLRPPIVNLLFPVTRPNRKF